MSVFKTVLQTAALLLVLWMYNGHQQQHVSHTSHCVEIH